MHHHTPHALPGTLLFRDWTEARALWTRLVRAHPDLVAAILMPNHVHLIAPTDCTSRLRTVLSAYTRWRNHHRGERGRAVQSLEPPDPIRGSVKLRRVVRYVHLNPCRKHICPDPLAWPFSTHRDATGLAIPAVRARDRDPRGFHRYVSSDPSVSRGGTSFPESAVLEGASLDDLWSAVSSLTRTPMEQMHTRGPARSLFLRAARTLGSSGCADIAAFAGLSARSVQRIRPGLAEDVLLVARVLRDPRFGPLVPGELRSGWGPYSSLR